MLISGLKKLSHTVREMWYDNLLCNTVYMCVGPRGQVQWHRKGASWHRGTSDTYGDKTLCPPHMKESSCSMGQKWTDICVCVTKENYPKSTYFLSCRWNNPYTFFALYIAAYIFPLWVRNKPHDRLCKYAFILGTVSTDANRIFQKKCIGKK